MLLDKGMDPDAIDHLGHSARDWGRYYRHTGIDRLLGIEADGIPETNIIMLDSETLHETAANPEAKSFNGNGHCRGGGGGQRK